MSQDASNPYAPPTPEAEPPELELHDDTEFLFNENCIVGRESIKLPAICILSGRRDNLVTHNKTLFWGYRGKIDVRYSVHPSEARWRRIMWWILSVVVLAFFLFNVGFGILVAILIIPFAFRNCRTAPRIMGERKGLFYLDGFCPEFLLQIRQIVERS